MILLELSSFQLKMSLKGRKVLLGVTGSVATIKLCALVHLFTIQGALLRIVSTEHALHFISKAYLQKNCPSDHGLDATLSLVIPEADISIPIYIDADEWNLWEERGNPVLHIELMRWADVILIAPLDANTLSKIAYGLCDNLLTSIMRALDQSKPLILCPAMNTFMWVNPITRRSLDLILSVFPLTKVVEPIQKTLICGDTGKVLFL